ncbi:unnamed protein product [Prunus armeniaca]|uniref:NAP1-related protein 2 n=1 Tax=Prunus armeniaca TaxID=36596 RepID=A0A6J5UGK3_PRUAR|nr:unnamed protein product [Prunus armeniaca]CAB4305425.1 unnamed protein product [Prunus armeniaca]
MVADQGKKAKLTERAPGDETDHIDTELVLNIEKLQEFQDDLDKVNEEEGDKLMELEQKFNEIRRPVYLKRNEIIKTIPDFWLTSFMSHPVLCDILTAEDQKIFKYLNSLDVEDFKDDKTLGYSITFNFNENPYFQDTKLTKTFAFVDDETTKVTGTTIKWKEGMGFANGVNDEKKGNKRPHAEQSFFSWFNESEQDDMVGFHEEMVEIIKDDLWPNPLKYFNNEADEEDSEGDEDNEMENGENDDGEDDNEGDS